MKNYTKKLFIAQSALLLMVPFAIFAQTAPQDTKDSRREVRDLRQNAREEIQAERKQITIQIRNQHQSLIDEVRQGREALRTEVKSLAPEEAQAHRKAFQESVSQKRSAFHEEAKTRREEFRAKAHERREKLKEKVGEVRAKRIEDFFDRMLARFEAALDRLEKLADRIEDRLDKLLEAGKDVSMQRALLDTARGSIAAAQKALDDARTAFDAFSASENPKEVFGEVKELVATVRDALKEAHRALVDVITSIKAGRLDIVAPVDQATTTNP